MHFIICENVGLNKSSNLWARAFPEILSEEYTERNANAYVFSYAVHVDPFSRDFVS